MSPIWAFLNSNLAIAGIGAIILQYISNQYQSKAKKNTLRMEWLKKTNEEQAKFLDELSHIISSINTNSLILSQAIVEEALDWIPEKSTDSDDEKNDDLEAHPETLTNNIRNWVNPILSNIQQRLTGPKLEDDEKSEVLKEHQEAFTKDIRTWMNSTLSNYYQIQRLTKPQSNKAANLFKESGIEAELLAAQDKKVDKNTTLATLVFILQYKILKLLDILEDLEGERKNNARTKKKPNSQIPTLSEEQKQQLLGGNFALFSESMDWVNMDDKTTLSSCESKGTDGADGEFQKWSLLLCTYNDVLKLLGHIDHHAVQFFQELNKGFQAHLKTVDDYIV